MIFFLHAGANSLFCLFDFKEDFSLKKQTNKQTCKHRLWENENQTLLPELWLGDTTLHAQAHTLTHTQTHTHTPFSPLLHPCEFYLNGRGGEGGYLSRHRHGCCHRVLAVVPLFTDRGEAPGFLSLDDISPHSPCLSVPQVRRSEDSPKTVRRRSEDGPIVRRLVNQGVTELCYSIEMRGGVSALMVLKSNQIPSLYQEL